MGSGCSSEKAVLTQDDREPKRKESLSYGSHVSDESTLSELSRPPTPFSRPLTGRVALRPRTNTIYEKDGQQVWQDNKDQVPREDKTDTKKSKHTTTKKKNNKKKNTSLPPEVPSPVLMARSKLAVMNNNEEASTLYLANRSSKSLTPMDQKDIDELKKFLKRKGL